jgi:hypothetical protein
MSDLDQVLDHCGGTFRDLLGEVDMTRVDRLVAAFERYAMRAQPIPAIEVIMAAHMFAGATAREIISSPDQRKAVCMAIAGYLAEDGDEAIQ